MQDTLDTYENQINTVMKKHDKMYKELRNSILTGIDLNTERMNVQHERNTHVLEAIKKLNVFLDQTDSRNIDI